MKPCTLAACSYCGQNANILATVTRRRHEKRCPARQAAAAAMVQPAFSELLLLATARRMRAALKDVQTMSAKEMGDMLTYAHVDGSRAQGSASTLHFGHCNVGSFAGCSGLPTARIRLIEAGE
ncbi:unnamed protein product, partial [Symbiodinium microadriaticum]